LLLIIVFRSTADVEIVLDYLQWPSPI